MFQRAKGIKQGCKEKKEIPGTKSDRKEKLNGWVSRHAIKRYLSIEISPGVALKVSEGLR
ncbi:hypothetical protein RUM43_005004 [Polyplax serrata]|uniref:Uncharacterized protein n=1 Tax=Polyplax serrata TaxID=468196 RepID=A0AAN8XP54_POLSC